MDKINKRTSMQVIEVSVTPNPALAILNLAAFQQRYIINKNYYLLELIIRWWEYCMHHTIY